MKKVFIAMTVAASMLAFASCSCSSNSEKSCEKSSCCGACDNAKTSTCTPADCAACDSSSTCTHAK